MTDEDSRVSDFINENYENIHVDQTTSKVGAHDPSIKTIYGSVSSTQIPVKPPHWALLYADISEGALEWIQVDAAYRGHGLGKALVNRISVSGNFTTNSGKIK